VVDELQKAKFNKNNNMNKQKSYHNKRENDDHNFAKGVSTGGNYNNYNKNNNNYIYSWGKDEIVGSWKMEDTAEKAKLKEKARAMYEKVN